MSLPSKDANVRVISIHPRDGICWLVITNKAYHGHPVGLIYAVSSWPAAGLYIFGREVDEWDPVDPRGKAVAYAEAYAALNDIPLVVQGWGPHE